MLRRSWLLTLLVAPVTLSGCGPDPAAPAFTAHVVSVVPSGGAAGVDPNAPIVITFSHPMQQRMEQYAALHEGDVRGAVVPGAWTWSGDRTKLTFTPTSPLAGQTQYTLHLGGGMRAMDGGFVDYGPCVEEYSGRWATGDMMGGGMMGGGAMMGSGWRHPNGTYGMVFSFTTS
ncbi:MAG: Ig-like domain-containing protein [Gemmatimonadota bacterium]